MSEAKIGFELRKIRLGLDDISPMRQIKDVHKGILRYKKILSSIKAVGLVEPLVVYPQKDAPGKYLLQTTLRDKNSDRTGSFETKIEIAG